VSGYVDRGTCSGACSGAQKYCHVSITSIAIKNWNIWTTIDGWTRAAELSEVICKQPWRIRLERLHKELAVH
jgi:hypothetical protein